MEFQNISPIDKNNFLEEINIDVNTVLNFSINIDNLKLLLTSLIKNQSLLSQKILDLEQKFQRKHSNLDSTRKIGKSLNKRNSTLRLSNTNKVFQTPNSEKQLLKRMSLKDTNFIKEKILEESDIKNKDSNISDKNIIANVDKDMINKENGLSEFTYKDEVKDKEKENNEEKKIENLDLNIEENSKKDKSERMESIKEETEEKNLESRDKEQTEENEFTEMGNNSTEIFNINNKLGTLEKKIKNLEILNKVNKFTNQGTVNSDDIQLMKIEIDNLKESNKKLYEENLDFKKQFEDINVKLHDINIYELFKNLNIEEGSANVAEGLIMNLENKVFKKISFIDERDKKINLDIMDLKTNIQNVINKNGVISHNMDNIKNNFKELGQLVTNNSSETINMINTLETKTNNFYKEIIEKFNENKNDYDINIKKINDKLYNLETLKNEKINSDALKSNSIEFTEENKEFINKMANRINEIESKINSILEISQTYSTKDELIKIEKELIKKVNSKEFFDIKDKYNLQLAKINNIEDSIERLNDLNEKNSSDLIFYAKRMENITSNILSIRIQIEDLIRKEKSKILDLSNFMEKTSFNKYVKSLQPEQLKIENNFEELRNLINDISNTLTKKCNAEDFKIFEDIINNKIEEIKLLNSKKYADKIDTNRSMKYLDSQIRHIIDVYIKKKDKNDSWLIAKKPMGGYLCASCESYIGDLKNKESYMPWNKYPQRDKDQNYRVGNGFSRMLNMLNIELKNNDLANNEKTIDSDDEVKKYFDENRIKIRIKNSSSNNDLLSKDKINRNNVSALLKSNSNTNLLHSNNSSKNTNTNILPKLFLNKNEDGNTIEPNSSHLINDLNPNIKNTLEQSGDEVNKESKESNESHPHIVKIFKKTKSNINIPDSCKTERAYSQIIK